MSLAKKKPEKTNEIFDKVHKNIDESIDLIKDYLSLEQYKKTKFLKHSSFCLNSLIEEILHELENEINKKNISVHYSVTEENLIIKTNKEWLKKALFNIIHNAVKYNKQNGHLFINIEYTKNGYLLIVKDTGIGISKKDKEKIFERYYTKDKDGSGIGLNFSKTVIESLGGKIKFDSVFNKGTVFYIYLPKISKKIKLKMLASALAGFFIVSFITIDYFYCLIPQKVQIKISGNIKIIKFENGIVAKANKNDEIKIIAYKNIFNTKTRNKLILQKSDIEIATNGNKIKVITPNTSFSNLGTKFETVAKDKTAISVFDGKIKNKRTVVNTDEGLIVSKTIQKVPLPQKISYLKIQNKPKTIIRWSSPYKYFKILISKDRSFSNPPIYGFYTANKIISPSLNDGKWYINIKAKHNDLYSIPVVKKFISLNNYYKALNYYKNNNIQEALKYIEKSVSTINHISPLPYYLYAKILFKLKNYKKSLKYIKEGEKVGQKEKIKLLKAKIFYLKGKYKKVIEILKNPSNEEEKLLVAKAFYKLGKYKIANKYLYRILEINPDNKEAKKFLTFPKGLKKQGFSNAFN